MGPSSTRSSGRPSTPWAVAFAITLAAAPSWPRPSAASEGTDAVLWPEEQRAFLQDGPALLVEPVERERFAALADPAARTEWIARFFTLDPTAETPSVNELREAIERRQRLAAGEAPSPLDVRARLVFLNGLPQVREPIDCGAVFVPIEIWSYGARDPASGGWVGEPRRGVLFRPGPEEPWRLWRPADGKGVLYTPLFRGWLAAWEELRGSYRAVRFDLQNCKAARLVDKATGVPGMTGALEEAGYRIRPIDASGLLAAPGDLGAWTRGALSDPVAPAAPGLRVLAPPIEFPDWVGQRLLARLWLALPAGAGYAATELPAIAKEAEAGAEAEVTAVTARREVRFVADCLLEQDGAVFDTFRVRFRLPPPLGQDALVLSLDRPVRPGHAYLLRVLLRDETSGAETRVARGFLVPGAPRQGEAAATLAALAGARSGSPSAGRVEAVMPTPSPGQDSLFLLPPVGAAVFAVWRAETLVTGERISRVSFSVDGRPQLESSRRPFSAEVRIDRIPRPQVVRAEGYDGAGVLVASDEVVLNQAQGGLAVHIVEPPSRPAAAASGAARLTARAEIVVPDGVRLLRVEFKLNDRLVERLETPPWRTSIVVPAEVPIVYLVVVATLEDGTSAEAVRYLRAPANVEDVDVRLIELFAAATDREGRPAPDLAAEDFELRECGRLLTLFRFERVENLPLTLGLVVDASNSMAPSFSAVLDAAAGFVESVVDPGDRAFVVSFAQRPRLDVRLTDDVGAVVNALCGLRTGGNTALYDALVQALFYLKGGAGQRALVLLSDGEDTASLLRYEEMLGYAQASGVSVYAIGLDLPALGLGIRSRLSGLAAATGGRAYFLSRAADLAAIYREIERELRARYLLAYEAGPPRGGACRGGVEVAVRDRPALRVRISRPRGP